MTNLRVLIPLLAALITPACGATIAATRTNMLTSPSSNSLQLTVSSHVAPAPARVTVYTRVEPDARSRSLVIEWWTVDGAGGSHTITLEGQAAAARHEYPITRLTEGEYVVTAALTRNDGSILTRSTRVVVVGEHGLPSVRGDGAAVMAWPLHDQDEGRER